MKHPFTLTCAALVLVTLCACSAKGPSAATPSTPAATPSAPPITVAETPPSSTPTPESPTPLPTPTPTPAPIETTPPPADAPPTDWLAREAPFSFGMDAGDGPCPLAVSAIEVGEDDVTVLLVPMANAADISAFMDAQVRIPSTTVSYDSGAEVLILQLANTALSSGEPSASAGSDDWVFDFIEEYDFTYPAGVPMGSLGDGNAYFTAPAISGGGGAVVLTLCLTDLAQQYQVAWGSLDAAGMHPYFRITFS